MWDLRPTHDHTMLPESYHSKSADDKIAHWVGIFHRQMRWAGEDGHDEVSIFTPSLIAQLRADDPAIDDLMPRVVAALAYMWAEAPGAFLATVNTRMGTTFAAPGGADTPR